MIVYYYKYDRNRNFKAILTIPSMIVLNFSSHSIYCSNFVEAIINLAIHGLLKYGSFEVLRLVKGRRSIGSRDR